MSMTANQLSLARTYLADSGTSAVQSIQIDNASGGTFTITFNGQTTSALAYNAGANVVQNAVCALSNVGVGNAYVINEFPYEVYFVGTLGRAAQPMLTVNVSALIGSGVIATVAQVTAGGVTAFTDDELSALYTDAKLDFWMTICYGFRALWANAAKFNDYMAGQTKESKSQIFDHLLVLADKYEAWSRAGKQVLMTSMVPEPPRLRAVPWTGGSPATSLSYGWPYRNRRNGRGNW